MDLMPRRGWSWFVLRCDVRPVTGLIDLPSVMSMRQPPEVAAAWRGAHPEDGLEERVAPLEAADHVAQPVSADPRCAMCPGRRDAGGCHQSQSGLR